METPLVIFLHIPRSGGTSMWRAARGEYGRRMRRIQGGGLADTRARVARILDEEPFQYDMVGGHVRFGIGQHCAARPCRYFTLLREPTDIILSRYYRRHNPDNPRVLANKYRERGRDPRKAEKKLHNQSDLKSPMEVLRSNRGNPLIRVIASRSDERQNAPVTRKDLESAKSNLIEHFASFGLVEHFEDSLHLIAAELDWSSVPITAYKNRGTNKPASYEQDVYDLGRELNPLDYEFYDFAKELFNERQQAGIAS